MAAANKKSTLSKRFPTRARASKAPSLRRRFFLTVLVLLALSPFYYKKLTPAWRLITNIGADPHYPVYKSFNIRIPNRYSIHGIDVSAYQGTIDWQKVKSMRQDSIRISFAYIKATEGVRQADPYFDRNWREAQKAGITTGAYHYFEPRFAGKLQARFFLQNVTLHKGNLPIAVDIEELDGMKSDKMRLQLNDFLKEVALKTKTRPIIYSGLKFYQDNLAGYYDNYSFWLSHFDHSKLSVNPITPWKFFQHSDRAKVNGIHRGVDFDAFRGDSLAFRGMLVR